MEFELRASKRKLFDNCGLEKGMYRIDPKTKRIFILLRWDLLVLFGTNAQLVTWDKYRVRYVKNLLEKHCTPLLDCKTRVIGSQSPKSDIDINMDMPQTHRGRVGCHPGWPRPPVQEIDGRYV